MFSLRLYYGLVEFVSVLRMCFDICWCWVILFLFVKSMLFSNLLFVFWFAPWFISSVGCFLVLVNAICKRVLDVGKVLCCCDGWI